MYLYGLPQYTISTDHEPLLPLYNTYKPYMPACIQSHKLATQGYDSELIYEPGEDNPTDYMSRHPLQQTASLPAADPELHTHVIVRKEFPNALTTEEIQAATATDKILQQPISATNKGYIPAENKHLLQPYNLVFTELSTTQDIILRGTWLLIPETLQDKAISLAHEGHMGIVKTKQYLRASVWFPNIDKKVESKIASCMPCQVVTNTNIKEPIKPTALPSAPWTTVNTDLYGPTPMGEYVLVFQCLYSQFPAAEIIHSTSAAAVLPAMDRIMSLFGIPVKVGSDNGPPYNSEEYCHSAKYMGFQRAKKIPLAPWANGTVEHFMKNLGKLIDTSHEEKLNWKHKMFKFLWAYRATPHSMTAYAPAELMFNRRPYKTCLPVPQMKCLLVHWQKVKANDNTAKAQMKEQADKKAYVHRSSIKVGDKVFCRQPHRTKHTTPFNNLLYTVIKVKGSLVSASRPGHTITRHITFFEKLANTPPPTRERTQAHHALPDYDAVGIQHQHPPNLAPNPPSLAPNPLPYQQPTTPNQTGIPSMEIK